MAVHSDLFINRLLSKVLPGFYFRRRCITLHGFSDKDIERRFRKKLLKTLLQQNREIPSACCCLYQIGKNFSASLVLYRNGIPIHIGEQGLSKEEVTEKLLDAVKTLKAPEVCPIPQVCEGCSVRKAHEYCAKHLPYINSFCGTHH